MAYLSVLMNRANTVDGLMERWAEFEADREAQVAEALREHPNARRVTFNDDVTPHYGNVVVSHIAQVISEHRRALQQGMGDTRLHTDAIAAWQAAARLARNDSPRHEVERMVNIAYDRTERAVKEARRNRR